MRTASIVLCASLMLACSQENTIDDGHNNTVVEHGENAPLLSLSELLNASDVKEGLALAAESNDQTMLLAWQNKLLLAADQVSLIPSQRKLISGEQGLSFLSFQGMKTNYQIAFEQAFYNFQDIDAVYARFPAFKNLHKRSKALVEQRDALVASVMKELDSQNFDGDTLLEARRQWQNFVKSQETIITPSN